MSRIEAMPITPLEVLAAGASVVASDIDAHREVARVTGGAVTIVDPDASASALAQAIQAAAVGDAAPSRVWSWEEVGDATLAVYDAAISDRR
jgi:glycosyltransferase involved in cell wall biosynthesis